jgi:stage II sporulation protein D
MLPLRYTFPSRARQQAVLGLFAARCVMLLLAVQYCVARDVTVRLARIKTVTLHLEDYVAGVVAGEGNTLPEEARKALAVASRSYAIHNMGRHRREGFDFCDTTHCQDLRVAAVDERAQATTAATEGELLWHEGTVANTFYSLHCGGQTESLPGIAYLRAQPDTFCVARGRRPWQAELSGVRKVSILERSSTGRVRTLLVDGRVVAWDSIEGAVSSLFTLHGLTLQGFGAGHGLGLCQIGAAERARAGQTYRQILSFYYPGTRVGLTPQGLSWTRIQSERWELWTVNPSLDTRALSAADRALSEAERRTGWRYEGPARLRIYPSVAAFRDASGEPGTVVASTLGRSVRMQPLRPDFETVLVHEAIHLLVNERARVQLPEWFREGLALWLDNQEPARSAEYGRWRGRLQELAKTYGRTTVLSWVEAGLPKGIQESSVTQPATKSR